MKSNYYRPEIDGLRAIAVMAVIFYHADLTIFGNKFFEGGFIGVDIFFTISGYLITSIILRELKETRKFSFINFYKRRARRILPVLFFVMIVSLPFAYKYLLPNFFIDYSKSIISSIGFASNFYFWSLGLGYDQLQNLQFQPFLHTWSLSVEEQYYFIFPILLCICFRYFRKYLNFLFILGIFISLLLADWMSQTHASFNFYTLPSRGWELLAGSLLANIELKIGRKNPKFLSSTLPVLGLLLIIFTFIFYNDRMFLPSFYTLPSILGVCMIIWFTSNNSFTTKIFSNNIFVGVGLISYSLYLWHYPIFILFAEINKYYLIIITFILSIISYYFIEKPFRKKTFNSNFFNIRTIVFSSLIILSINTLVIYNDGFYNASRYPNIIDNIISRKFTSNKNLVIKPSVDNPNKNNIYVAGDSHMNIVYRTLLKHPKIEGYNLHKLNYRGCYYIFGFDKTQKYSGKIENYCDQKIQNERKRKFLSKKDSIIILGGRLPMYLSGERYDNLEGGREGREWHIFKNENNKDVSLGVRKSILDLLENNLKVIIVYPVPPVGWYVPKKILDAYTWNKDDFENYLDSNPVTTSYESFIKYSKKSFETLDGIKHQNLYRVYPHKLFCDNQIKNRCVTHDNKNIFYTDNNHLSETGGIQLRNEIIKKIDQIEKSIK